VRFTPVGDLPGRVLLQSRGVPEGRPPAFARTLEAILSSNCWSQPSTLSMPLRSLHAFDCKVLGGSVWRVCDAQQLTPPYGAWMALRAS
jgi:hypothetical protein